VIRKKTGMENIENEKCKVIKCKNRNAGPNDKGRKHRNGKCRNPLKYISCFRAMTLSPLHLVVNWPVFRICNNNHTCVIGLYLWPPYGIRQAIIFLTCDFFLSIFFFPRLISAVGDWMSTILPHLVWP